MSLRSWAIRGLILGGVAGVAALAWVAHSWVSPERVRAQVIAHLSEQFEGADIHVGSAHMQLFGGIAVSDVRITRHGGDAPFLVIPSAVLSHDKEQLNRGRLVIKKVELENPEIRLERGPDGKWNLAEVLRPSPSDKPVPTFVVKGGTVHVEDRGPDPLPPLTLTDVSATVLNDPLPVLTIQLRASAKGFGPASVRGQVNRVTGALSLGVEMPDFPLGEFAATAAKRFAPEYAEHLTGLAATAGVTADLKYTPDAAQKWQHDVRLDLKDAKFTHPKLQWPVEKIAAGVRVVNGLVRAEATAQVNGAKVKLSLDTRTPLAGGGLAPPVRAGATAGGGAKNAAPPAGAGDDLLQKFEDHLERAEVTVTGVPLDDALFKQLPEKFGAIRRRFSPVGQVDAGYKFARERGAWKREFEVRPKQINAVYEKFKYPVADLRGWIKRTDTPAGPPVTGIDLIGTAGGQLVTIKGSVTGDGDDPGINIRVTGENFPMDETLVKAFPPKYAEMVRRFRATGRGGFVAEFVQQPGVNLCENEFRVDVRDATVNHVEFPILLEKLKGRLVIRTTATDANRPVRPGDLSPPPDRDEIVLDGFTAVHAGAAVWLNGSRRSIPNSRDQKITLHVGANSCPVDADAKAALAAIGAESVWARFNPSGRITLTADVELIDRAGPPDRPDLEPKLNPATDLRLTFDFSGATVLPSFFRYELTDVSGWLQYKNGRVDVARLAARHGDSRLTIGPSEIRLYPDGAVWANLGGLELKPLVADPALIKALPRGLGSAVDELRLKGGAELLVKHLVVLEPPDPVPPPESLPAGRIAVGRGDVRQVFRAQSAAATIPKPDPVIYWDAEARLAGASFDTGVLWEQVFGAVACRGRYEGTHTGLLRGNVWFDRAVVARQPITRLTARAAAAPQLPDPARAGEFLPIEVEITDVNGDLFRGTLGGQARVVMSDQTRYSLWLTATDVQLEEVAKHYRLDEAGKHKLGSDADLKGIAQAQLLLYNRPDPKTGHLVVEGSGSLDVPTGRMYNLPVLLDLVKVLKGMAPDKTAFEEAHATFRVLGDRIKVEQLDLIGKAVCLGGSGELDTSGEYVKFEFYTLGSQILAKMVNTPVGDLTAFLSKNLFKIKLTRENGELKYKPEAVPMVTEPVRSVADRLRARAAWMFGGK